MTIAAASAGGFGREVVLLLKDCAGPSQVIYENTLDGAFDIDCDSVVVATWRPDPPFCLRANDLSFERGRPWLPVVMEYWRITVGPVITPPGGPCYLCLLRRRAQHDARHAETAAVEKAFGEDESAGPRGYMPYHARIAASLAMRLARLVQTRVPPPDQAAGVLASQVIRYDLVTSDINVSSVMRCHDCSRCAGRGQPVAAVKDYFRCAAR